MKGTPILGCLLAAVAAAQLLSKSRTLGARKGLVNLFHKEWEKGTGSANKEKGKERKIRGLLLPFPCFGWRALANLSLPAAIAGCLH